MVATDMAVDVEFKNLKKGSGGIIVTFIQPGLQNSFNGTCELNDDYSEISTSAETWVPGAYWIWDGDLDVTETTLKIVGTSKYSDETDIYAFSLTASK